MAHLLNFDGSDTMSAGYYAQFVLNGGKPVAQSIPASEHRCAGCSKLGRGCGLCRATHPLLTPCRARCRSVMTAWDTERAALVHMIENFGSGAFACVMDRCVPAHARRV